MDLSRTLLIFNIVCIVLFLIPVPFVLIPILIPIIVLGNFIICSVYAYRYWKEMGTLSGLLENMFFNAIGIATPPYEDGTQLSTEDCANAATLCQGKSKYFNDGVCYCGPSNITCDNKDTGTCYPKTNSDKICSSLTTNCSCLQQVNSNGTQQCYWESTGPAAPTGYCIGNIAENDTYCSSATENDTCTSLLDDNNQNKCIWVSTVGDAGPEYKQSGTCNPNTPYDTVCNDLNSYTACVSQVSNNNVRQCYWTDS